MTISPFSKILKTGLQRHLLPGKTQAARVWYRNTASAITKVNAPKMIADANMEPYRMRAAVTLGEMYAFMYRAKHEDTLPYYDRFPLIFPFRLVSGGFYGINMHYLYPFLRARLMDALYELAHTDVYDEKTKLAITYKLLNSTSKFKWFKPCVHRYLNSHVQSRFIHINSNEWDIALFLPTERFVGARKQRVWLESQQQINNG